MRKRITKQKTAKPKNQKKEIIVDPKNNQTKTPGLFAAGDVCQGEYKQIMIAAGDGGKAALAAHNYLKIY